MADDTGARKEEIAFDLPEPALPFPVVGVGASAGGIEAFSAMLRALPPDTGMAFVFVTHLAPNYPSQLDEVFARLTDMPVVKVEDDQEVAPDHVYVIPPNTSMVIAGGRLRLTPRDDTHGRPQPIDTFLLALASEQGRRAIGVLLSGLGDDGTVGLEEIKGAGGFAFAQDSTAQQVSMPRSAIAAGCVDLVLPPEQIAGELRRMARHPYVDRDRFEAGERLDGNELREILDVISDSLGADFSHYKHSTLFRRVTRRMVLHKLHDLGQYLELLRSSQEEVENLFHDILINVTSFFRNPEAFEALRDEILPALVSERSRLEPLRIWVLGCSTGEEAYSIAIICQEFAQQRGRPLPVQIFATDLNPAGIEKARSGVYSRSIEKDVSPERLRQFFVRMGDCYRVNRATREMCVFATHNGLAEPPFSRMDLVSCRNMMIYLERSLQERLMPTLHYALKPGGILWLGPSEAIVGAAHLFDSASQTFNFYGKKAGARSSPTISAPGTRRSGLAAYWPARSERPAAARSSDPHKEADRLLLARYAPPGVLVTADLEILQFRGDTSRFIAPASGTASLNLLKMLPEALVAPVRNACDRARRDGVPVRTSGIALGTDEDPLEAHVEVIPVRSTGSGDHYLVTFSASPTEDAQPAVPMATMAPEDNDETRRLLSELAATREYLQSVVEQQEAANEELQAANEEVQSANEELQSINEELQTSKEEIESSNEELATLNDELSRRNHELSQTNNDLVNLLASVRMPIIMLGANLRIRRVTPAAERVLNVRSSDVGRSISDLKLGLSIDDLEPLVTEVIDSMTFQEMDVQDKQGRWHSLRIWPYRTLDNRLDGVVLLLVDIDTLARARRYAEAIVAAVAEPLLVLDADLRVQKASDRFYDAMGLSAADVEQSPLPRICDGRWNTADLRRALDAVRYTGTPMEDFEHSFTADGGVRRTLLLNAQRLTRDDGDFSIVLSMKDITHRKALEESLRTRVEQLAQANRRQTEFLAMLAHELRNPLAAMSSGSQVLQMVDDPDTTVRTRAMMERQIAHMARMIDDLLDVSRITSGRIHLRLEPLDLAQVVHRTCEALRPALEGHEQHLHLELDGQATFVDGDPMRLEQILANLLGNSSKFTHEGGNIWVTLSREQADGAAVPAAVVRVRDDGTGLAPEMLSRVFEPFMQVHRSTGSGGGLGIGLTLVRRLVELHGGQIQAGSEGIGRGSVFELRLPIRREDGAMAPMPRTEAERAAAARRVLIVDDNVDAAESLAVLLRLAGHQVRTAHDGEAALHIAARFDPDAILLDIGLPGMDGYEVARRLRKQPQHADTALIAVTGYGQGEDRRKSADAGFNAHLMKPVELAQVETTLARLTRGQDARDFPAS
ncbi:MAG TPA: chemotaxis protein CheB [Candidatus Limnocylindrales bacterium]|nr:chemotaxis protein CheB [Candidatus Limnocylindrales bacterium]